MAARQLDSVVQHLRRVILQHDTVTRTDGQLLGAFIERQDEAAFEALVRRHGPMVFGVCCRVLGNCHDAEDAFQATFLVLARKAASVRPRDKLGNWLYGVAQTTALRAKAADHKRRRRDKQMHDRRERAAEQPDPWAELKAVLDQELARLPDKYREAIVLCDLEGRTRKDVARQLKLPEGTVASRLATGRKMLARRLARFGVPLASGALAALLSEHAAAAPVSGSLLTATVQAARISAAGVLSAPVTHLMEEVLTIMLLKKLKTATIMLTAVLLACSGLGLLSFGQAQPAVAERGEGQPSLAGNKQGLAAWQGVWRVVSVVKGDRVGINENAVLMVRGNRACWDYKGSEDLNEGGLYLDPSSRPKAYDFVTSRRTFEGTYSLEGDTLRLCWDLEPEAKRPRELSAPPESSRALLTLKRMTGLVISNSRLPDGTLAFPKFFERPVAIRPPPPRADAKPVAQSAPKPALAKSPVSIGQIFIVGNEQTPDAVIREQLGFLPGQTLHYPDLREAEKRLAGLGLFVIDPQNGIRPTVTPVSALNSTEGEFQDVIVQVRETLNTKDAVHPLLKSLEEERKQILLDLGISGPPPAEGETKQTRSRKKLTAAEDVKLRKRLNEITAQQADRDLNIAEFYRRTGHDNSARFYYELVCRRYPGTTAAATAMQRLDELKEPGR